MSVGHVGQQSAVSAYQSTSAAATSKTKAAESTSKSSGFSESAAVYEPSSSDGTVTSKSKYDTNAIVAQLKADQESRLASMQSMVSEMMGQQGLKIGQADDMWKFLASGNYTVSEAAKAEAQQAISEDGYWGVNKTSDRILEFAKALSGNDPSKAQELLDAFDKGVQQATKAWGRELPDITKQTSDAVHEKFQKWMDGEEE